MTILRIDSSVNLSASSSRALADQIIAYLPDQKVITRDVAAEALPHITKDWAEARLVPADDRNAEQRAALALSDTLIEELRASDTLIISAPIYNFAIPASLKAWIDLIARPGETFSYTSDGPKGLLTGKQAIVAVASGGTAVGSDIDFATGYLRHVLGFVGITDVTILSAAEVKQDPKTLAQKVATNGAGLAQVA